MDQSGVVRRLNTARGESTSYSFIHLTLQEFCAAWYIAQGYRQELTPSASAAHSQSQRQFIKELLTRYAYESRWAVVWWFVAGMLRDEPPSRFLSLLI